MYDLNRDVVFYFDDDPENVKLWQEKVTENWQSDLKILTNEKSGYISPDEVEKFISNNLKLMLKHRDRILLVCLDLDFTNGSSEDAKKDIFLGWKLLKRIRKRFPLTPVFIVSQHSKKHMGNSREHDVDEVMTPLTFSKLKKADFFGKITQAQMKRREFLSNIPDIPPAYLLSNHHYFKNQDAGVSNESQPFAFIAYAFDKNVVPKTVLSALDRALKAKDLIPKFIEEEHFKGKISNAMGCMILECDLFVADITKSNANVFYEIGMATAANKPLILIKCKDDDTEVPFDVREEQYFVYDIQDTDGLEKWVKERVACLGNPPIFNRS